MSERKSHHLVCVPPAEIATLWPVVMPMIDAAYAEVDELMPPDMERWLANGKGLLWVSIDRERILAALTTSLIMRRSGKVCRLVACGGSRMDLWKDCHAQIEEYAKAEGCVKVYSEGRPGWARVLHGYKPTRVSLEKTL